jgi:DNA/RNA endonuclease YhcR with UshA esterase domain
LRRRNAVAKIEREIMEIRKKSSNGVARGGISANNQGNYTLEDRMKKMALLVLGAALVGSQFSWAQDDSSDRGASNAPATSQPSDNGPTKVDASDADAVKAAVGQRVILEGTIAKAAWASSGKVMKATFKGNEKLSLVAFQSKKDDLDKAFGGDFATTLAGAKVQVSGLLKQFNNKPELVIDDAKQVKIEQPGASTQSSQ